MKKKLPRMFASILIILSICIFCALAYNIADLSSTTEVIEPIQVEGQTSFKETIYPNQTTSMEFTIANTINQTKGHLFLTFDDAIIEDAQNAIPIMNEYGYRGTAFFATKWRFYLLNDFAAAEWEIGCHTYSHVDLNRVSQDMLYSEIVQPKLDIEANISGVDSVVCFAYPYGSGWDNDTVTSIVHQYYNKSRPLGENWDNERSFDGTGYESLALNTTRQALDFAKAGHDAWLMFHAISDTPTDYMQISTSKFRQVLDMINASGITPMTWTEKESTVYPIKITANVTKPAGINLTAYIGDVTVSETELRNGWTTRIAPQQIVLCKVEVYASSDSSPGEVTVFINISRL